MREKERVSECAREHERQRDTVCVCVCVCVCVVWRIRRRGDGLLTINTWLRSGKYTLPVGYDTDGHSLLSMDL
jgi:hypothetical protein